MRLKSLELKGFKSFAEKTIINFSEDVIGIVGSNGCGKSNIVDAIRWVLGEQKTRQLRSRLILVFSAKDLLQIQQHFLVLVATSRLPAAQFLTEEHTR